MTSLIGTESVKVLENIDLVNSIVFNNNCYKKRHHRHVLKSKENTYKHKCGKILKRKLKKYKLRQNGEEDQDVIDVSKSFVSSLTFKSEENSANPIELEDLEYIRPKNYLFKMVRRKIHSKNIVTLKFQAVESSKLKENEVDTPVVISSQEKKQTNAFKLLMDSRNKSIGGNSPGKEKNYDQVDSVEVNEKKSLKAKRNLVLQKLAEAKGSLKNKEMEEYQDNIIKKKMEKRAENLKKMILKNSNQVKNNESSDTSSKTIVEEKPVLENVIAVTDSNSSKRKPKALKVVDIFNTLEEPVIVSPIKKEITKEDKEFLNKLSPSLKKKESMLSYFKKVDKSPEHENYNNIIKVKLQKKKKRKKLSLKRETLEAEIDTDGDINVIINKDNNENQKTIDNYVADNHDDIGTPVRPAENVEEEEIKKAGERQKRKRTTKTNESNEGDINTLTNEGRPKRSTKRPVKYNDDAELFSSDDDLHIFTPKKKKHIESIDNDRSTKDTKIKTKEVEKPISEKNSKITKEVKLPTKSVKLPEKPVKLAPIFAPKQLDQAALEAKQKFLHSGVPDKLKKIMNQQKSNNVIENNFPIVVHVQQKDLKDQEKENNQHINFPELSVDEVINIAKYDNIFQTLLNLNEVESVTNLDFSSKKSTQGMLKHIKQLHPKFPVYRTYSYLKGLGKGELKDCNYLDLDNSIEIMNDVSDIVNDNPDKFSWTAKYKISSAKQIIGNFDSIKELRKWLVSWTENAMKFRGKGNSDSDSSDYYQSDADSRDSMKSMNNLIIITGPTGCGKTSSVYAVAADLAMKVIEVNASSRRTGKIMLQDLHEATQSHKVNRGTGNLENSQKSQEKPQIEIIKKIKKRGRPKKIVENVPKTQPAKHMVLSGTTSSSQDSSQPRTDMSLILIDDADIVFDQDDGFSSAIVQLVHSSKRPVILITSSLSCPHLQRFLQNGKVLKLCPLLPRLLGTWLDIMCLADNGLCWPGIGGKFLNYFKGDIRKTINFLQYYLTTYVHNVSSEEDSASQQLEYKNSLDDENSSMSWADHYDIEARKLPSSINMEMNPVWAEFINQNFNLLTLSYPLQLFNLWWSIPGLLSISPNLGVLGDSKLPVSSKDKKAKIEEMEAIANVIDTISFSDYISQESVPNYDISCRPWYAPEQHSVSELENMHYYSRSDDMTGEICHTLVTSSISVAQDVVCSERKTDVCFPGMSLERDRDRLISRHKNLTSYLNGSAVLDRRALALDYWSTCRTICRLEKTKTDTNSKRNNRFCHYLKSLSVLCKSDTFDNLCDSLSTKETHFNE